MFITDPSLGRKGGDLAYKTFEIHDRNYGMIDRIKAVNYRMEGDQYLFFGCPTEAGDRILPGPILYRFRRQNTIIKEVIIRERG